jgi:hypothetical protein
MGVTVSDRVKETTTKTGTGDTITLGGAVGNFRTFDSIAEATTFYCMTGDSGWEIGAAVVTNSTTLTRAFVLTSSDNGSPINWAAGPKEIFCCMPAAACRPDLNAAPVFSSMYVSTADNTPAVMALAPLSQDPVADNNVVEVTITAQDEDDGLEAKAWRVTLFAINGGVVGSPPSPTVIAQTAGASAWTFTYSIDNSGPEPVVVLTVTGDATLPVYWSARVRVD